MTNETLHSAATNAAEFLKALLDAEPDAAVDALTNNGEEVEETLRAALKAAPAAYTWAQLETAAIMWECVLRELRRHREARNPWEEYRQAYGTVALRCRVIQHAPDLYAAYEKALDNKYEKDFDQDFVSKYLEDHVTRILT